MPITDVFLEVDSRKDRVMNYTIDFDQRIDERTGKPVGRPVLTQFAIRIRRESEAPVDTYIKWQLEPTMTKDFEICFYDNHQLKRQVRVKGAYLINYNQYCLEPGYIEESLALSPDQVDVDNEHFDRKDAA